MPDSEVIIILGDPFMRAFYTIFNYDELTVTLATYKTSTSGLSAGAITGIVLGVLFLVAILIGVGCYCHKKNKAKTEKRYVYDETSLPLN